MARHSLSPFCCALIKKQNINLVKLISEKDRIRTMNILFKVKLQVLVIEFAALLKRCFPNALFSRNFESWFTSELLWTTEFERLRSKTFFLKHAEEKMHGLRKSMIWRKKIDMLYRMSLPNKKLKRFEKNVNVGALL